MRPWLVFVTLAISLPLPHSFANEKYAASTAACVSTEVQRALGESLPKADLFITLSYVSEPTFKTRLIEKVQFEGIFRGMAIPKDLGGAALKFMKTKNSLGSDLKAQLWSELTVEMKRRNPSFISYMFTDRKHRYLFRGGLGETLFIDADGVMYRTSTGKIVNGQVWKVDYSALRELLP